MFFIAFFNLDKRGKVFTGTLFSLGFSIHFYYGYTGLELFDGISQNMAILAIVLLAPLLSIPLKLEGITKFVVSGLNRLKDDSRKLYYSVTSFMLILSPILNVGSIRMVNEFVSDLHVKQKLLSNAYFGGISPTFIWSPFFASLGIILYYTGLTYLEYFPIGIIFVFFQVVVAFLLVGPIRKRTTDSTIERKKNQGFSPFYLLIIYVVLLVCILILLEEITNKPMTLLVTVICIFLPILYTILRRKWSDIKTEVSLFKQQLTTNSNFEIALFLSAGLLGNALLSTKLDSLLKSIILWSSDISIMLLFFLVICFVTLMSIIGIHQIVVIPIILTLLISPDVNIGLFVSAFMCIFTWMLSASLSPLNVLNVIISRCVKTNGVRVAYYWNGKYFLSITILAFFYVFVLDILD
ncbi:hypothetical protein [Bacillus sp. 1P02SD]|uniref:hypothetical protein n=1 Tax=Bacillus sp. 1P02SD TaxID=3132264 RepID=UPI00399F0169